MSSTLLSKFAILPVLALITGTAFADATDDCIADFEAMKIQFESASSEAEFECVRVKNAVSLFATGPSPQGCPGEGEWHFEVRSHGVQNATCSVMIRGSEGEGCEAPKSERTLSPPEAAKWRNFVNKECI